MNTKNARLTGPKFLELRQTSLSALVESVAGLLVVELPVVWFDDDASSSGVSFSHKYISNIQLLTTKTIKNCFILKPTKQIDAGKKQNNCSSMIEKSKHYMVKTE